jgi:chromate transporter
MELLRRRFEAARWLAFDEHALLVAVSRLTPGTNVLAYCTALGWLCHRAAGAALALLASSVPGAVIVIALSAAIVRIDQWPLVQGVLAAATLAASTLIFSTAWHLLRPYLSWRRSWALASIVVVVALSLAGVTPVRILLLAAAWGALTPTAAPMRSSLSTPAPAPPAGREESS